MSRVLDELKAKFSHDPGELYTDESSMRILYKAWDGLNCPFHGEEMVNAKRDHMVCMSCGLTLMTRYLDEE